MRTVARLLVWVVIEQEWEVLNRELLVRRGRHRSSSIRRGSRGSLPIGLIRRRAE